MSARDDDRGELALSRTGGPLPQFLIPCICPHIRRDYHGPCPIPTTAVWVWGRCRVAVIQVTSCPRGMSRSWQPRDELGPQRSPCANIRTRPKACAYSGALAGLHPLQDSFARGFGVGTRHRGAAIVCQITTGTTAAAPTVRPTMTAPEPRRHFPADNAHRQGSCDR
jgi:hypothetical protein